MLVDEATGREPEVGATTRGKAEHPARTITAMLPRRKLVIASR
jgi:hypothetical protein